MLRLLEVHVVPVWDDNGRVHVCGPEEVRLDLEDSVVGWTNLLVIELNGVRHVLQAGDT